MNKQLEDIVYVFADLTHYWRQAPFPRGFGVTFTSTDRSRAAQAALYGQNFAGSGAGWPSSLSVWEAAQYGPNAEIQIYPSPNMYTPPNPPDPVVRITGGGYPVAPPGTSQHEYGFAFDAVPNVPASVKDQAQRIMGRIAGQLGLHWGGEADPVHFAMFSRDEWRKVLGQIGVMSQIGQPASFPFFSSGVSLYTGPGSGFFPTDPGYGGGAGPSTKTIDPGPDPLLA